jgi:integrase
MPRQRVPSYRRYKPKNLGLVVIDGKQHYLGRYGTPESLAEYNRLIQEWLTPQTTPPEASIGEANPATVPADRTIDEILVAFWQHAERHYRSPGGKPTGELDNFKLALRPLQKLYGHTPARSFSPLALRAVRDQMIRDGLCRTTVNARINRIRRVLKWAVGSEMVPPSIHHALQAVPGLQRGRTDTRESERVVPVPIEHVEAVLPHLPRPVAAMVRLQLLTGCRTGEVLAIRGCDLIPGVPTSEYRPPSHKTAWRGHDRVIPLGPRAQAIVKEFLRPDPLAYLFSPQDAVEDRNARHRQGVDAKPSRKPAPQSSPGGGPSGQMTRRAYLRRSYRQAIIRGCRKANVPAWTPCNSGTPPRLTTGRVSVWRPPRSSLATRKRMSLRSTPSVTWRRLTRSWRRSAKAGFWPLLQSRASGQPADHRRARPGPPSHLAVGRGGRPDKQGVDMPKNDHLSRLARAMRARSAAIQIPAPVSRLPAAYQLGYCRHFSWMWSEDLWLHPEEGLARENAQAALSLVRQALVDLANRLDTRLLHPLHRTLDELTGMTRVWEWSGGAGPIDPPYRMSEPTWRGLLEPAERCLDGTGGLGPWCRLGGAMGQYQNELQVLPFPGEIEHVDLGAWPDIRPIVHAAQDIPVTDLRRLPLLRSMVRLASLQEEFSQAALLNEFINENVSSWTYRPDYIDFMTMDFVILALDQQIRSQLECFASDPGSQPGVVTPKPVWDRTHRELRYRGILVRPRFRFDASAMVILDAFQDHEPSWPRRIDDPIPGHRDSQPDRLKDAINTLNHKLTLLKFLSDGTDEGIIWKVVGTNQ